MKEGKSKSATYEPRFTDPRVSRRVAQVLNWCEFNLDLFRPREAAKVVLDAVFGSAGHDLSDYLRAELLITYSKSYCVGQYSKRYLLNADGYDRLRRATPPHSFVDYKSAGSTCAPHTQANPGTSTPVEFNAPMAYFEKHHGKELATLSFNMKDKSKRLWHPLQNLKRERKADFWATYGLPFDYDIEACAPTILFQLAIQADLPEITLATLRSYLDDRATFRFHVSALSGLAPGDAKRLINSLFNGARLAANGYCTAFRTLHYDYAAMRRLQNDRKVTRLNGDIKRVWRRLELVERQKQVPSFADVLAGTNKPTERRLKTSKQRWGYYFTRERQVLDVIMQFLDRDGNSHFTEHDGFRTQREVPLRELEDEIHQRTGLRLTIQRNDTTHSFVEYNSSALDSEQPSARHLNETAARRVQSTNRL